MERKKTKAGRLCVVSQFDQPGHLGVFASLAALPLLLALGREALARGCVDLVVGGHTHVQSGPDAVDGEDDATGYTWTNGTTGGAAYAIAVGSKPRRDADVSLITYRDGRPTGLQWVRLGTDGSWLVGDWTPIEPG